MSAEPIPSGRWWGDHLAETRCVLEAARLTVDPVWYGRGSIPRGDGRPVVVVPGFLGGDYTLAALARWLRRIGYADCVDVAGSHVGLIFNRKSYRAIATALAAPELPAP